MMIRHIVVVVVVVVGGKVLCNLTPWAGSFYTVLRKRHAPCRHNMNLTQHPRKAHVPMIDLSPDHWIFGRETSRYRMPWFTDFRS